MNRIDKKFIELKKKGKKAFIAFITAGYPDLTTTGKLVLELEKNGVDIIELGVPFSDPLADGPVIQEASLYSLKKKTNLVKILDLVKSLRKNTDLPICLMSYYNPIFCFGDKKFADEAIIAGVDGVIIPDLPPEEAKEFILYADKKGLANICFLAPTSSQARIKIISKIARGFIYYVSLTGVTGSRKSLAADLKANLIKIKKVARIPVCAGFGISNAKQLRQVQEICDGGIVGSAIVNKIRENIKRKDLAKRVGNFAGRFNV
ncbi:MAG: tryptophan synthase subunit alpha [Candidatus Omnitrophica bacterium]|jgi:tryptophan synthase alpha chain|nr:tryptophan synthase subunit alpha [Candidatus Omnitrophota bacterium]MDD5690155.1 tryptophan synthase subunit alpha [Candidatus Omnitrophota bacterium]